MTSHTQAESRQQPPPIENDRTPGPHPPAPDSSPSPKDLFGAGLESALVEACDGRLHGLHWFRTDWQRGGALTGYAHCRADDGTDHPVVVKLPVPPQELLWLQRLQPDRHDLDPIVPELHASGRALRGYDLAWVVMERLPHGPLDTGWNGAELTFLVEAAGRFYAVADRYDTDADPRAEDWPALFKRSREAIRRHELPHAQRWNHALKTLQKKWKKLGDAWARRDAAHWCHGDLHLGNAMSRQPPPDGPALVFDLAHVHVGHWVEDAVYFEHLYWSHPERLNGHDVPKLIHRQRKQLGLPAEPDWPRLADLRRALLAAAAPAQQTARPNPEHLEASLHKLEQVLGRLK